MKKSEIKTRILQGLQNNEYAGFKYGDVKKIIIEKNGDEGFVGIFYKNCKICETYKGPATIHVEIFHYSIDIEEDEEEEGIITKTVHFYYDLHFDANSNEPEWHDKIDQRQSDRDFFDFWT